MSPVTTADCFRSTRSLAINEKVLPILKKQTGFVDETLLVSDAEPNRILALSFWNSKDQTEAPCLATNTFATPANNYSHKL